MICGREEFRRIGFDYDPESCDLLYLKNFVFANRGRFLEAKTGVPFDELEKIYKKRDVESYKFKMWG